MTLLSIGKNSARRVRGSLPPVEGLETARQTYHAMLDQQIAPQLHEWGMTGEGETYEYPSASWFLRLAFVPAAWNTTARFQFDVNVIAVSKPDWQQWQVVDPTLPEEPDPAVYYAHDFAAAGGVNSRLGEFDRGRIDMRWTVYEQEEPTAVAAEVLARIMRHVIPAFASRATDEVAPPQPAHE